MSAAATAAEASVAPPKKKKAGVVKLVLAFLVTAGLAAGGAFFAARRMAPPAAANAEGEAPAAPDSAGHDEHDSGGAQPVTTGDYFSLAPSFVVNLNDEDVSRFLQIEVEVMAAKPAALDAVRANLPVIRNRLVLLFSSQKYRELLPREGKEKLQQQALDEVNKVLEERKKPRIDGVMFTSFVMQ